MPIVPSVERGTKEQQCMSAERAKKCVDGAEDAKAREGAMG